MENTNEEINKKLEELNCNYIIEYGNIELFRFCDLNDKEIQYSMFEYDVKVLYDIYYYTIKKMYKEMMLIIMNKYRYMYCNVKGAILITAENITVELKKFLMKYKHYKLTQYNLSEFITDYNKLDECIEKYMILRRYI